MRCRAVPESTSSPLLQAVSGYTRRARARLGPQEVETAVRLLKEVNRRLPGRNLLQAGVAELKEAGARLFAEGEPREGSRFLSAELRHFFDAALADGLIVRHPLTGQVSLPRAEEEAEAAGAQPAAVAEQAAKVVADLLEDAVRVGLLASPIAVPLAELGEGENRVEELLGLLAARWSWLASQLHWLLQVVRVAVPLAALVFGVSAALDPSSPLTGGQAMLTGQAMQELRVTLSLLEERELPAGTEAASLEQLGDLAGAGLQAATKVFTLERAVLRPPVLYLRERASGALVVVTPGQRGVLRDGGWRVVR